MSKNRYTDALCILITLLMLLTVLLFRHGEELGITVEHRENTLSELSASAVISLSDEKCRVKGSGAYVQDGIVTIVYGGEYTLTGTLSEGRIVVEAEKNAKVKLILDHVSITSGDNAALWVKNAGKVILSSAKGSENLLQSGVISDGDALAEGVNAAVYSQDDLVLQGKGQVKIVSESHGVHGKDELTLESGEWLVEAAGDGLRGRDGVEARGGSYVIRVGGSGIRSNNELEEGRGSVLISGGTYSIEAARDGVRSARDLTVEGGSFTVTTGGGAAPVSGDKEKDLDEINGEEELLSAKGLKAAGRINLRGGSFVMNCADDAIHTDGDLTVEDGDFYIVSGDDAMHANESAVLSGGSVTVADCREGLEAQQITLSGVNMDVTAWNDGINANGRSRGVAMSHMTITGGSIRVRCFGDGLDSNGDILLTGGTVLISADPSDGYSAVDYGIENGGNCIVQGGTIIACGYAGAAESFTEDSSQCSLLVATEEVHPGGTSVELRDRNGKTLCAYTPEHKYNCIVLSDPALEQGSEYVLCLGESEIPFTLNETVLRMGSGYEAVDRPEELPEDISDLGGFGG